MNGFYNLLKPEGISSSHLVVRLRGMLRNKTGVKMKVGHLGTLDPLASGLLGVAVGSATKLFDYFLQKTKTYEAIVVLGEQTDTLDRAGKIVSTKAYLGVSEAEFIDASKAFIGEIMQIPPQYSAKSVGGVRAYKLALKGQDAPLKACCVTIYSIELIEKPSFNSFKFRVRCSGGTYVRSLCRDIGNALGYPAYMSFLERIENGDFRICDAVSLEDVEKDLSNGFVSLEEFGKKFHRLDYFEEHEKKLLNGVPLVVDLPDCFVTVYLKERFYAIGQIISGELKIVARDL